MTRVFLKSTTALLSIALALPTHALAQDEGLVPPAQTEDAQQAEPSGQPASEPITEDVPQVTEQEPAAAEEGLPEDVAPPVAEEAATQALTEPETVAEDSIAETEEPAAEDAVEDVTQPEEPAVQEEPAPATADAPTAPDDEGTSEEPPAEAASENVAPQADDAQTVETSETPVPQEPASETPDAQSAEETEAAAESMPVAEESTAETQTEVPEEDPEQQLLEQQAQADAAAEAGQSAAAAQEGAEDTLVETQESVITEEDARSSNEEFTRGVNETADTPASDQTEQSQGTAQVTPSNESGNDLLRTLGTVAAVGLGAYAVGQILNNGSKVVSNSGDRVVLEQDGRYRVIKDDDTLLRRPGSQVRTQTFSDGSTRTIVSTDDGAQTVTIRSAEGQVLRRERILPYGERVALFDDTRSFERVDVRQLSDRRAQDYDYSDASADELRAALQAAQISSDGRSYSLNQIRHIDAVRHQVPVIALDAITFETGSSVIRPAQAAALSELGNTMREAIAGDPSQVFLIEGHTDTVGADPYNLALSDRRAESVALALAEYFDVPPANMIVQGYGESDLKVRQAGDIRANRRAAVRNITSLLQQGG